MIEKLKALGESAKGFVIWVLAPIGFIVSIFFYQRHEINQLEEKLKEAKIDADIQKTENQLQEAKHESDSANADYQHVRDEYIREHSKSGDDVQ